MEPPRRRRLGVTRVRKVRSVGLISGVCVSGCVSGRVSNDALVNVVFGGERSTSGSALFSLFCDHE